MIKTNKLEKIEDDIIEYTNLIDLTTYFDKTINNKDMNYVFSNIKNNLFPHQLKNCGGNNKEGIVIYDRKFEFNKYIIIYTPIIKSEIYLPNITLNKNILINHKTYNLIGAIYYNGAHYVYQEYINGKIEYTFDDATRIDGEGHYNSNKRRVMILYAINESDELSSTEIINLKKQGKPLDTIINKVIKSYCLNRDKITVYGSIFDKYNTNTLYNNYLSKYPKALLIINDNYKDSKTNKNGGGNAGDQIRQYNIYSCNGEKPRIAGITTGPSREYKSNTTLNTILKELDGKTPKQVIDEEIKLIKYIIIIWGYTEIIYSCGNTGELGSGIFVIPQDIKDYITKQLLNLGARCFFIKEGNKTEEKIKKMHKYINILN
jgi:hypothetical protein